MSQRFCLYTQNSNCWSTYFPRQSKPQSARLPRFLCLADQSFHRNIIGFTLLPKKGWIPLHHLFRGHFTKEPMKGSQRELCILKIFYLFLWLHQVLGEACRIFSCSLWDPVLCPGIEPGLSAVGARSLSLCTTSEVAPGPAFY